MLRGRKWVHGDRNWNRTRLHHETETGSRCIKCGVRNRKESCDQSGSGYSEAGNGAGLPVDLARGLTRPSSDNLLRLAPGSKKEGAGEPPSPLNAPSANASPNPLPF